MGGSINLRPQESQSQGHCSKVKGHRTKIPRPCTSNPRWYSTDTDWSCWHQYHGHSSVHKNSKVKVTELQSKVTEPKFHAHAHLSLMGSPQTQTGHVGINTMDTAASTRTPRSRSWLEGQRTNIPCSCTPTPHGTGSLQTGTGYMSIKSLDTGSSTRISSSRSWLSLIAGMILHIPLFI